MTIAVLLAVGLVTIGGSAVSASSSSAALSKDAGVFISPAASSTVSGRVTWQVGAITSSVYQVDFSIDGGPVTWSEWQSPYMYNGDGGTLDTTTLGEGAHTLQVVEYDSAGRVLGTAEEVVTVDNQPAPPPPHDHDHADHDHDDTRPRRPAAGGTVATRRARTRRPRHRRPRPPRPPDHPDHNDDPDDHTDHHHDPHDDEHAEPVAAPDGLGGAVRQLDSAGVPDEDGHDGGAAVRAHDRRGRPGRGEGRDLRRPVQLPGAPRHREDRRRGSVRLGRNLAGRIGTLAPVNIANAGGILFRGPAVVTNPSWSNVLLSDSNDVIIDGMISHDAATSGFYEGSDESGSKNVWLVNVESYTNGKNSAAWNGYPTNYYLAGAHGIYFGGGSAQTTGGGIIGAYVHDQHVGYGIQAFGHWSGGIIDSYRIVNVDGKVSGPDSNLTTGTASDRAGIGIELYGSGIQSLTLGHGTITGSAFKDVNIDAGADVTVQ